MTIAIIIDGMNNPIKGPSSQVSGLGWEKYCKFGKMRYTPQLPKTSRLRPSRSVIAFTFGYCLSYPDRFILKRNCNKPCIGLS